MVSEVTPKSLVKFEGGEWRQNSLELEMLHWELQILPNFARRV